MIIGVTCALVVAMVITGVIVGVKFNLDSTNEIVTVYLQVTTVIVREDVYAYYHLYQVYKLIRCINELLYRHKI